MKLCIRYYAEKNQAKNNFCNGPFFTLNEAYRALQSYSDFKDGVYGKVYYVVEEYNDDKL